MNSFLERIQLNFLILQVVAYCRHSVAVPTTSTQLAVRISKDVDANTRRTAAAPMAKPLLKDKTMMAADVSTRHMAVAPMKLLLLPVTATRDVPAMLISLDAVQMVLQSRPVHTIKVKLSS